MTTTKRKQPATTTPLSERLAWALGKDSSLAADAKAVEAQRDALLAACRLALPAMEFADSTGLRCRGAIEAVEAAINTGEQ